ncbi:MAG: response regulator [Alphaproteobacteria bacterium]|nr:response regulator [Alphaproteobacteria bacterium]
MLDATTSTPAARVIAIVDDDEDFSDSLAVLLETAGFSSSVYRSVSTFLLCIDHSIRGVVLDVHMPGLSGPEAIRAILRVSPALTVVTVTGRELPFARQRLIDAGAAGCLPKPLTIDALLPFFA